MKIPNTERLTRKQKNANKKQYFKDKINSLDMSLGDIDYTYNDISEEKRLRVNYDLFNNIIDVSDFETVCKPYGGKVGALPIKMTNKDIVSSKIKAILGMEAKRPFNFTVYATNPEATDRKEKKHYEMVKEYTVNQVMAPIREQVQMEYAQKMKGQELSEEEQEKVRLEIQEEVKSRTPEEAKKYMERDHKDVAEIMTTQLLEYLQESTDARRKFNKGMKHASLGAKEIYYVGDIGNEPNFMVVNPKRFACDGSEDIDFIQDKEWAVCEYPMTPSMIISYFGDDLKDDEIDRIYQSWGGFHNHRVEDDDLFALHHRYENGESLNTIPVVHGVWKGLRKIGFLKYEGKDGTPKEKMVDETYKLKEELGDIDIKWEWLNVTYETWKIKITEPIYIKEREIPGQLKDINTINKATLPYYGAYYDDMNSVPTGVMDRLKPFQYFYNILNYRFETLASTDKGKKILMNIKGIPQSEGIDLKKWKYLMESSPMMWYNPDEEGMDHYTDSNTVAKVLDLSYAGDMNKYVEMMEYVRQQAGRSIGVNDQVEGQISPDQSVRNVQQGLTQTSNILEPYFELHDHVKKHVMSALIEQAKVCWQDEKYKKLSYSLDDMSQRAITLDMGLLDSSSLNLFIQNGSKAEQAKQMVSQLTHAAVQNQKAELSDVATILRQDSIVEIEETLRKAERARDEKEKEIEEIRNKGQQEKDKRDADEAAKEHEREKEIVVLKEEERRKTVFVQGSLIGASYNPDADKDGDGENDYVEMAKQAMEREFREKEDNREERKFQHQKSVDKAKAEQEKRQLQQKTQ